VFTLSLCVYRYTISELAPFAAYQLNISAVNEIGSSSFSSQVAIRTVNASKIIVCMYGMSVFGVMSKWLRCLLLVVSSGGCSPGSYCDTFE